MVVRGLLSYDDYLRLLRRIDPCTVEIGIGFVPGRVYANEALFEPLLDELRHFIASSGQAFLPALLQIANVASLPGIVGHSIGLPDVHSGYGFAIGNVAAFDMDDPQCIVSPGGIGYDINCGVRLLRTNLRLSDLTTDTLNRLADELFAHIPVGVGARNAHLTGYIRRADAESTDANAAPLTDGEVREVLEGGMSFAVKHGLAWPEDAECTESRGCYPCSQSLKIGQRPRKTGAWQLGTLGSGNHYVEVQAVDEIYDPVAACAMGILEVGQVCAMIHCGSRGLGHQVASEFIDAMADQADRSTINDVQLAYASISSPLGRDYLVAMSGAANFAFVNRSAITTQIRAAFEKVFGRKASEMDLSVIYDVSHNIASVEEHVVDGARKRLLVHRKGSTRALPPGHPDLPEKYRSIGQPVMVGGSMGTWSYLLTGCTGGSSDTFGTTCHGAGRKQSRTAAKEDCSKLSSATADTLAKDAEHAKQRHQSRREQRAALARAVSQAVLADLHAKGIIVRVASPDDIAEEGPDAYKDVNEVIGICEAANISKRCVRFRPICVIKG